VSFIKNPVLSTLQRMIGISPVPGPIILDDTNVSLVLPMVPDVTRRSLAGIRTGWYLGMLEVVHSGADFESAALDPYNAGVDAIAPYPPIVPEGFDVWLLGVGGHRSSGAGGLVGANFSMNPEDENQGWGRDDAGAPVVGTPSFIVAAFDSINELVTAGIQPMQTESGETFVKVGIRVPRGGTLGVNTQSAAAAEFQAQFLTGLFPAGLGQDIGV